MDSKTYSAQRPRRWWRNTETDSGRGLVSMSPVDSDGIWTSNQSHWLGTEVSFSTQVELLKSDSGCVLGNQFMTDWSWSLKQARNHVVEAVEYDRQV